MQGLIADLQAPCSPSIPPASFCSKSRKTARKILVRSEFLENFDNRGGINRKLIAVRSLPGHGRTSSVFRVWLRRLFPLMSGVGLCFGVGLGFGFCFSIVFKFGAAATPASIFEFAGLRVSFGWCFLFVSFSISATLPLLSALRNNINKRLTVLVATKFPGFRGIRGRGGVNPGALRPLAGPQDLRHNGSARCLAIFDNRQRIDEN
jgi:hypothetical protein